MPSRTLGDQRKNRDVPYASREDVIRAEEVAKSLYRDGR